MPKLGSESHQLHMWVLWLIFHYCQCSWLVQYNYKVYCLCQWNYREDQQLAEGFADISKGLSAHWLVDGVDILLPTKLFVKRELDYSTCLSDWHFQNYHPYAWGDNFPNWVCVLKRIKKKTTVDPYRLLEMPSLQGLILKQYFQSDMKGLRGK